MSDTLADTYPLAMRILHWLIALLIIGLLAVGFIMTSLDRDSQWHGTLYHLHKSFGVTVLALAVVRLALRLTLPVPPLPSVIPAVERFLAHAGHWALYLFMFLMPVSGWIMSNSFGQPATWFGFSLPRIVTTDRVRGALASDIHYYGAWTLILLLAGHISAVLFHYLRQRVNLLRRML